MMILHICHDDKFLDIVYRQFEYSYPNMNKYVILSKRQSGGLKYIKNSEHFEIICENSSEYKLLLRSINNYTYVIIHYLGFEKLKFLLDAKQNSIFIWFIWGGDIRLFFELDVYDLETKKLLEANMKLVNKFQKYIYYLKNKLNFTTAIRKVDYVATVLPNETMSYKKLLPNRIKYLSFTYGCIDDIIFDKNVGISGDNILIGNSGDPSNNHITVLKKLTKINIENRKIILVLNYGSPNYIEKLTKISRELHGDKIVEIRQFLSLSEYNLLLATCSVAFMNHFRQQALGNVLILLWLGVRVYLNSKSPVYLFLKELGMVIFALDLDIINFEKLTVVEKNFNQQLILENYNFNHIQDKVRELFSGL